MAEEQKILLIERQGEAKFMGTSPGTPAISFLKLTNPSSFSNLYFKIDTSEVDNNSVKPNEGAIQPKKTFVIAVFTDKTPTAFTVNIHAFNTFEGFPYDFVEDVWADDNVAIIKTFVVKYVYKSLGGTAPVHSANSTNNDQNKVKGGASEKALKLQMPLLYKRKVTDDASKMSSKPMDEIEEKLLKAKQEIETLKDELRSLRQENLQLKSMNENEEELLKAKQEIETLKDELRSLRQENSQNNAQDYEIDMKRFEVEDTSHNKEEDDAYSDDSDRLVINEDPKSDE